MADAELMIPFLTRWEGGYSNHPNDKGGCTMRGITLKTYQSYYGKDKTCADLKNITEEEWLKIFKKGYWNSMKADQIENQSLAELCVDWIWNSGANMIKRIQSTIGTEADGKVGPKTLGILNSAPKRWFTLIWSARWQYYNSIVAKNPSQRVFLDGWRRRLSDIRYKA